MKAVNLEKLLPCGHPARRTNPLARPARLDLACAPRFSRRFRRRLFRGDDRSGISRYRLLTAACDDGGLSRRQDRAVRALAALALLALLAWLGARTTLYVITSRRLVMKIGIALPIFFNLPFSPIASAALRVYSDGTGDIPVALGKGQRIAYLHLWPHARPFRFTKPEPALRCVRHAARGRGDTRARAARRGRRSPPRRPSSRPTTALRSRDAARPVEPAAAA